MVWTLLLGVVHGSIFAGPAGSFNSPKEQSVFDALRNGHPVDPWQLMSAPDEAISDADLFVWKTEMGKILDRCRAKSAKPTVDLVFRTLRASYLKTYKEGVSTAEVFRSGQFNCLSASALVGLGMEMMGWMVEFRVEPTHVYLLVHHDGKWYRVETTAEDFGAIRIKERQGIGQVGWVGLAGLQYYNSGLLALDAGNLEGAARDFSKAWTLNPDPRVGEMLDLAGNECRNRAEAAFANGNYALTDQWMTLVSLCGVMDEETERIWIASLLMEASRMGSVADAYVYLLRAAEHASSLLDNLDFATSLAETGLAFSIDQMMDSRTAVDGLGVLAELEGSLALESLPVDPDLRSRAYGLAAHLSRAFEEADMMASSR